jgi:hypothetical protein
MPFVMGGVCRVRSRRWLPSVAVFCNSRAVTGSTILDNANHLQSVSSNSFRVSTKREAACPTWTSEHPFVQFCAVKARFGWFIIQDTWSRRSRLKPEWINGHIAGAQHAPLSRLRRSAKAYLQRDKLIFVCAAGSRSKLPAQLACGRPRLRAPAAASCRMMSSVA